MWGMGQLIPLTVNLLMTALFMTGTQYLSRLSQSIRIKFGSPVYWACCLFRNIYKGRKESFPYPLCIRKATVIQKAIQGTLVLLWGLFETSWCIFFSFVEVLPYVLFFCWFSVVDTDHFSTPHYYLVFKIILKHLEEVLQKIQ